VRRERVRGVPLALGVLGAVLGLLYVRNVGVFFVLFPFAAAPFFAGGPLRLPRGFGYPLVAVGLSGFLLAPSAGSPGLGLQEGRYPEKASEFLAREGIEGRLFNEVAFGGYLIWRFPGRGVFIDGRNEIYPALLQETFTALRDPARFWALTERWGIQAAMLRYPRRARGCSTRGPRDGPCSDPGRRSTFRPEIGPWSTGTTPP